MVSYCPSSLSPTCSLDPTLSSSFPPSMPSPSLVTLSKLHCSAQTHCPTCTAPPLLWASVSPSVQERGRILDLIHHRPHHVSMEQVLIEKKGREGECFHLLSTNGVHALQEQSSACEKAEALRRAGTHLRIHSQSAPHNCL